MHQTLQQQARHASHPRRAFHLIAPPAAPAGRRVGRFSDGIEQLPRDASSRIGRFSDGAERVRVASTRVGTFADGIAQRPATDMRVGSFGDRDGASGRAT